ncbi:MAG: hypothetical protein ABIR39_09165 [Nocardioides sp.]|uniref:hypothetical protein n=1 Tax=Nocardioides sp. TaxID=35761 RepID=UPI0032675340
MSERVFEAFREDAERLTEVPAFELIERQGRSLRRRRRAVGAAVAASVLGLTGFLAIGDETPEEPLPAEDPEPSSLVTPYPGPTMTTLEKGTYEFASPPVRFTVPPGWNAWMGPNRFEGMGPQVTDNEKVLDQGGVDWYVGLFLIELDRMTGRDCISVDVFDHSTPAFARALARIPGLDVTSGPESTVRFGRPAVHLRLCANAEETCPWILRTPLGYASGVEAGNTYDAWVVDLDGRPFLVWAEWTRKAPNAEVRALLAIIDTIEIVAKGP